MTSAEENYSVSEKEALSVIRGMRHFEDILNGGCIVVITDHKPLLSLLKNAHKAPSSRLKRWALYLTGFDVDIVYEAGKTHYLADYLSRVQTLDPPASECEPPIGIELLLPTDKDCALIEAVKAPRASINNDMIGYQDISIDRIIEEQRKDDECKLLLEFIQDGTLPPDKKQAARVLAQADFVDVISPGVLCHFPKIRHKSKKFVTIQPQIVIPPTLRDSVLYLMHNDILAG